MMTALLLGTLYLLNKIIYRYRNDSFLIQVRNYLLLSMPILIGAFLLYWVIQIPLIQYFSVHHVDEHVGLLGRIDLGTAFHFFATGYLLISIVIFKSYHTKIVEKLEVIGQKGKTLIQVNLIEWIKKEGTLCEVNCGENKYTTNLTINKLTELLNRENFIRVNRSAIVNKALIVEYNYWENHKYILKVGGSNKEFVVTRKRFKIIKEELMEADS